MRCIAGKQEINNFECLFQANVHLKRRTTCDLQEFCFLSPLWHQLMRNVLFSYIKWLQLIVYGNFPYLAGSLAT